MPAPSFPIRSVSEPLFVGFRFAVEIDSIQEALFTQCSGIKVDTKPDEIFVGGRNGYTLQLPTSTKIAPITLKYGLTNSDTIWNWYKKLIDGTIEYRRVSVFVVNTDTNVSPGKEIRWTLHDAIPIGYQAPVLDAGKNEMAIDSLVIACCGRFERT